MVYKRNQFEVLTSRVHEKRRFMQVLAGPRQSGKTTLAEQVAAACEIPVHFISADDPEAHGRIWRSTGETNLERALEAAKT